MTDWYRKMGAKETRALQAFNIFLVMYAGVGRARSHQIDFLFLASFNYQLPNHTKLGSLRKSYNFNHNGTGIPMASGRLRRPLPSYRLDEEDK
jgi:hypothetical protein